MERSASELLESETALRSRHPRSRDVAEATPTAAVLAVAAARLGAMNASAARRLAARHTFTALPEHRCALARSRSRHRNAGSLPKLPWPPGRCATVTHLMAAFRRAPAHVLRAPRVLAACCQWALAAVEQSIRCRALNVMSNVLDTVASRAGSRLLPTDRMPAAPRGVRVPWHVILRVTLMYPI